MRTRDELVEFADSLITAAQQVATSDHATIVMPGLVGGRGARVDGLEGFARTFLLASFRIAGSPSNDPKALELSDWYAEGIAAGVDPRNPNRWIRQTEASQAHVESASIALGLDMCREQIWERFSPEVKRRVVEYLAEAIGDDSFPRNNWLWFRVVIETFLRSVGGPWSVRDIQLDLQRYDSFAREDGWYTDGAGRKFDHYAGWAMHLYPTIWSRMTGADELIQELDPGLPGRSRSAFDLYLKDALSLVGADGSPLIQGRSLIYRFAAAAPFWVGALAETTAVPMGQLRSAALSIISHFQENGVPNSEGLLDLGWHHEWPRMAQSYSGPSSPYWASKGLMGIALPPTHPVWSSMIEPLPIENTDFTRVIEAPGWVVSGTRNDGIVRVANHGTDNESVFSPVTDSPLYARFGYSTATSPLLRDADFRSPSDQSVTLLDSSGSGSHRTGLVFLGSEHSNVASSLNYLQWIDAEEEKDRFGGGLRGENRPAGIAAVHSILHGSLELRIVRVLSSSNDATILRCSGWPVSGSQVTAEATARSASILNENGLTSDLAQIQIHTETPTPKYGTEVLEDASFLGPRTGYPFVEFVPRAGEDYAIAIELGQNSSSARESAAVNVRRNQNDDGSSALEITWPDGQTEHVVLDTLAETLMNATEKSLAIIRDSMDRFKGVYPSDNTVQGRYPVLGDESDSEADGNVGWTSGFWVGECAMAYQLTKDAAYLQDLDAHFDSFSRRLDNRIDVDHHDLGFLYTLAGTLPYYLTGEERFKSLALRAADVLMDRYLVNAGIIQAWGDLNDSSQQGRAIIDSLMNLPLLYWATAQTGDVSYESAARRHANRLLDHIIRDDDTTHHTYYFDPETGEALYGRTAQGAGDASTWARGQAWGIYGFALSYAQTNDPRMLEGAVRCADRFLDLLPRDHVPYWDMIFADGDDEPRDSSAGAIAVCGLLELSESMADTGQYTLADKYHKAALQIMESLMKIYATKPGQSDALLDHSVYSKPDNRGVDEGTLWGDYFYMEALSRLLDSSWINPWLPPSEVSTGR